MVKIFTFGSDDMNLMAYGRVGYKYPEGTTNMKEWAGRYKIVKGGDGELRFTYVQVILVSVPFLGEKESREREKNISDNFSCVGSSRP